MSFVDKFLDVMRLNPDDDDYDFDNEEYEIEEEVVEDKPKKSLRKEKKEEVEPVREPVKERAPKPTPKITPISKPSRKQSTGMEVCVIKPSSIEDELEITDTLLNGRTVIINMEGLNVELAQRIIDFISGATYSMNGSLQKISNYIFLATPNGVDISGDIQNLMTTVNGAL